MGVGCYSEKITFRPFANNYINLFYNMAFGLFYLSNPLKVNDVGNVEWYI